MNINSNIHTDTNHLMHLHSQCGPSVLTWAPASLSQLPPFVTILLCPNFCSRTVPQAPRTSEKCSALNLTVFLSVGNSTHGRHIEEVSEPTRGHGTIEDDSSCLIDSRSHHPLPRETGVLDLTQPLIQLNGTLYVGKHCYSLCPWCRVSGLLLLSLPPLRQGVPG